MAAYFGLFYEGTWHTGCRREVFFHPWCAARKSSYLQHALLSASRSKIENPTSKIQDDRQGRGGRTLKLTLAYDGTNFAGWQVQRNARTVQETLETALKQLTEEDVRVTGSGRTDSGVHAAGQVASFETASTLSTATFRKALNATLPEDLVVLAAEEVPAGFNALRSARRKRYRYTLHDGQKANVFRRRFCWAVRQRLDDQAMSRAAAALVGTHDFSGYETLGSPRATTVRTIFELDVTRQPPPDDDFIYIEIEADGFLYNMARAIAGTLYDVGRGASPEILPHQILATLDRRSAGQTAPAQGLCLLWVEYEERRKDEG
ncbi:MAG: tRNA pseudouridine(38-40) synthase TruA [Pirellulales bacterium]